MGSGKLPAEFVSALWGFEELVIKIHMVPALLAAVPHPSQVEVSSRAELFASASRWLQ